MATNGIFLATWSLVLDDHIKEKFALHCLPYGLIKHSS